MAAGSTQQAKVPGIGSRLEVLTRVPIIPEGYTLREVERRIDRACKTLRAMPDSEKRFIGLKSQGIWEQVVQEFWSYGSEDVKLKFNPTPADVSDYLTALTWVRGLTRSEFNIIWWRSFDVSFSVIAARIGRSDETARRRYDDAIHKAWGQSLRSVGIPIP